MLSELIHFRDRDKSRLLDPQLALADEDLALPQLPGVVHVTPGALHQHGLKLTEHPETDRHLRDQVQCALGRYHVVHDLAQLGTSPRLLDEVRSEHLVKRGVGALEFRRALSLAP
jgi:hypothetical protein